MVNNSEDIQLENAVRKLYLFVTVDERINSECVSFMLFFIIGTSYISTLIFAVLSDWKLTRSTTIIIGKLKQKLFKSILLYRLYHIFNWLYIVYHNFDGNFASMSV